MDPDRAGHQPAVRAAIGRRLLQDLPNDVGFLLGVEPLGPWRGEKQGRL
jgi:hypothetical protein